MSKVSIILRLIFGTMMIIYGMWTIKEITIMRAGPSDLPNPKIEENVLSFKFRRSDVSKLRHRLNSGRRLLHESRGSSLLEEKYDTIPQVCPPPPPPPPLPVYLPPSLPLLAPPANPPPLPHPTLPEIPPPNYDSFLPTPQVPPPPPFPANLPLIPALPDNPPPYYSYPPPTSTSSPPSTTIPVGIPPPPKSEVPPATPPLIIFDPAPPAGTESSTPSALRDRQLPFNLPLVIFLYLFSIFTSLAIYWSFTPAGRKYWTSKCNW